MQSTRYPLKTILGAGIAALLSVYSVFDAYSRQTERNKAAGDPYHMQAQVERFQGLKRELQQVAVAGYFSDMDSVPGVFLAAEYALAPTVLADPGNQQWVVGDFYQTTDYTAFAQARRLVPGERFLSWRGVASKSGPLIMLLLASLVLSILAGYLVATLLLPASNPRWAAALLRLSLGAGLGAGISSCLYFLAWLLIGPSTTIFVSAELLLAGAAGAGCWLRRAAASAENPRPAPITPGWLLLLALAAALALAVPLFVHASVSDPYGGWDALAIWNLRAEFLAQNTPQWKNAFSPLLSRTQPGYPLLVSGYVASCWRLTGAAGDVAAPIATAALYALATTGLLVAGLAILRGWCAAMLGGLLLLGTAAFLEAAPAQYADIPLAFYYLAAMVLLLLFDACASRAAGIAALTGLAMGCAAWTKNEGLLFALFMSVSFFTVAFLSRKAAPAKMILSLAAGGAVPLAIALYFKFFLAPATTTFSQSLAQAAHKFIEWSRYGAIIKVFLAEALRLGPWTAHPILSFAVLAGCFGLQPGWRRKPAILACLATLLALSAAYCVAYLMTPMDLAWHLANSAGRLYIQLWPALVLVWLVVLRSAEETVTAIEPPRQKALRVSRKKLNKAGAR